MMKLKKQNFYDFFDSSVSYFHAEKQIYVFCFFLAKTVSDKELMKDQKYQKTIPLEAFEYKKTELQLKLKFRKRCKTRLEMLKDEQEGKYANDDEMRKGAKQK